MKLKIKRNDIVKINTGKDKNKSGKVLRIQKENNTAIVEGINMLWKHMRKSNQHPRGARIQKEGAIQLSNLIIVCQSCQKPTKVKFVKNPESGKIGRICKLCHEAIVPTES